LEAEFLSVVLRLPHAFTDAEFIALGFDDATCDFGKGCNR
jgi:hypothetical protein